MNTLILLVNLVLSSAPNAPACETVGPRLDGTTVTICDGRVVKVSMGAESHVNPFTTEGR